MENQYGITVANKYALFLNEDVDPLEILKLQEVNKATKKSEKGKKGAGAGNENDPKAPAGKQNTLSTAAVEKKSDKIDQFSSPVQNDDKSTQGRASDKDGGPSKVTKDRSRRPGDNTRTGSGRGGGIENQKPRNTDPNVPGRGGERPPRRDRQDRERPERRPDRDAEFSQQTEKTDTSEQGGFERRDGFAPRGPRSDRGGFRDRGDRGSRRGDRPYRGGFSDRGGFQDRGGFGERTERQGFDDQPERNFYGDRPPRRGGYRGRGRGGERNGFGERTERSGFDVVEGQDHRGTDDQPSQEEVSGQGDRGGFEERRERGGFDEHREGSGFEERRGGGREFVRRGRGGGRGYSRGRGGPDRPGRREFERHTEGGMRPADKRDGAGSHNWGTVMDDIEGQQEKLATEGTTWAEQVDAEDRPAAAVTGEADKDGEVAGGGEEEERVLTYEEWKSQEEARRVKTEFNIRKAGEGCSDPQWKKMVALSKKEKEEHDHEHEEEHDEDDEDRHVKARNVLNIDIRFADNPRRGVGGGRGPGRGGRGGGRGARGGGPDSYRENRESQYRGGYRTGGAGGHKERAPNVADEEAFPSLDKAVATPLA